MTPDGAVKIAIAFLAGLTTLTYHQSWLFYDEVTTIGIAAHWFAFGFCAFNAVRK